MEMSNLKSRLASMSPDKRRVTLQLLPQKLAQGLSSERFLHLLTDFSFIEAKVDGVGIQPLIEDYDWVRVFDFQFSQETRDSLRLIQDSLKLSANILAEDKTQLLGQLVGRLMCHEVPDIQAMLEQAKQEKSTPWLRPLTSSLTSPGGGLLRTLTGHSGAIKAVAMTPDRRWAISASDDHTLKLWNLDEGIEYFTLTGHSGAVNAVAMTPDRRWAISASDDHTLKLWNLDEGIEYFTLTGHSGAVKTVAMTPDRHRALSGSHDGILKLWDLENGTEQLNLIGYTEPKKSSSLSINAVAMTPDRRWALSASNDHTLKLWDLERGVEERTLTGHHYEVQSTAITPDGRWALFASYNQLVLWDFERGTKQNLTNQSGFIDEPDGLTLSTISATAITPDGRWVLSGTGYGSLKLFDIVNGGEPRTLIGHSSQITAVAITPDGQWALSGSGDRTLKLWNLASIEQHSATGHAMSVTGVAVTIDGRWAISGSHDSTLKQWDLTRCTEHLTLTGHTYGLGAVAVTPDGRWALSGAGDLTVRLWDLTSGTEKLRLTDQVKMRADWVTLTPDGRWALFDSSFDSYELTLWNLKSGIRRKLILPNDEFSSVIAFASDGEKALFSSKRNKLELVLADLETGEQLLTFSTDRTQIAALAMTRDIQFNSSSSSAHPPLKVWDLDIIGQLFTLTDRNAVGSIVAVTPDGRQVLCRSFDKTLILWNLETGTQLLTLYSISGTSVFVATLSPTVGEIVVTPDGQHALFNSNNTVRVWDLTSGSLIASFSGDSIISDCAIAPDGVTFVVGDKSGRLHFLRLENLEKTTQPILPPELPKKSINNNVILYDEAPLSELESSEQQYCDCCGKTLKQVSWLNVGPKVSICNECVDLCFKRVANVVMTPNKQRVISTSGDGVLRVWDFKKGLIIASFAEGISFYHKTSLNGNTFIENGNSGVASFIKLEESALSFSPLLQLFSEVAQHLHKFQAAPPSKAVASLEFPKILRSLARQHKLQGRYSEAEALYLRSLDLEQQYVQSNPDKLYDIFAQILRVYNSDVLSKMDTEIAKWTAIHISNFSNFIRDFSLGNSADNIEISITGCEVASTILTREAFPEDWAMVQNNLGLAYIYRVRENRAENLEKAIAIYEDLLQVYTHTTSPQDWARTQNNVGLAYKERIFGDRAENIEQAIRCYQMALQVRTHEALPQDYATTQTNLGKAYQERIIGDRAENIEQAIHCYQASLQARNRTAVPGRWADTQRALGIAYFHRIRGDRAKNLDNAIRCQHAALQVIGLKASPKDWAITQYDLGLAYFYRIWGDRAENLDNAIRCYQAALEVYTREASPKIWAITKYNLGLAYFYRICGNRTKNLDNAIQCQHAALQVFSLKAFPRDWAKTQIALGNIYFSYIYQQLILLFKRMYRWF
jgi:WD40 repeat protein/tetratricopeptide (TPR) repeat protein